MIQKLGPYRIETVLGRGGMGTVYVGVHEETGQRAAVKALSPSLMDDGNFRERFVMEIATLKKLRHPHIVELYGDGQQDDYLFYAMELVEGKNLQEEMQRGKVFDWREVVQVAVQVCQALKHAHDHGVIHRDLKPANLLRLPTGLVKLTDFGIAKLFGQTHLTADGSVVGTADYMSPEQAEGRGVTNRTDLYSLGAVMFTLLAKRPPFVGNSIAQVVHKLRYDEPQPIRRFAAEAPAELEQIIAQLLKKDPQDRIPTALVLSNRLQAMDHAIGLRQRDFPGRATSLPTGQTVWESPRPRQPGDATEVSPTAVGDAEVSPRRPYAWNDATVVAEASASVAAEQAHVTDAPGDELRVAPAADTLADAAPPSVNRYTLAERAADAAANVAKSGQRGEVYKIAALAAALLALAAFVIYSLLPPDADQVYSRVIRVAAQHGPAAAHGDIEQFLERFPRDPRHAEIHALWMDVQCDWLYSRLRVRAKREQLPPVQAAYVAAMQQRAAGHPAARTALEQILTEHGQAPESSSPVNVLDAVRHLLARPANSRP